MSPSKIIWGASAIAAAINASPDFVRRTLVGMPDSPVHRCGRRYWAFEAELRAFFRRLSR
jgi:hypothetical protein